MASSPSAAPRWRLELELGDHGHRRTAVLDFEDRQALEAQLAQLERRDPLPFGRLLEFTNEAGEMLAVVAAAYVGHSIRPL